MDRQYEALKDFEAPGNGGTICKGQVLTLSPKLGAVWAKAGLVKEVKAPVPREGKEVKADGK
ncbi:MAG: hypothetical protein Q8P48_07680 [Deltaproteobacteria bacterium]|nr:hypothetical protein [Deltaproteobacteria bacterium]